MVRYLPAIIVLALAASAKADCASDITTLSNTLKSALGDNKWLFGPAMVANLDNTYKGLFDFANADPDKIIGAAISFLSEATTAKAKPAPACFSGYLAAFLQGDVSGAVDYTCTFSSSEFPSDLTATCLGAGGIMRGLGLGITIGQGFDLVSIFNSDPALKDFAALAGFFAVKSGSKLMQHDAVKVCIPASCTTQISNIELLVADGLKEVVDNLGIFSGTGLTASIISKIPGTITAESCEEVPKLAYSLDITKLTDVLDGNTTMLANLEDVTVAECGGSPTRPPTLSPNNPGGNAAVHAAPLPLLVTVAAFAAAIAAPVFV